MAVVSALAVIASLLLRDGTRRGPTRGRVPGTKGTVPTDPVDTCTPRVSISSAAMIGTASPPTTGAPQAAQIIIDPRVETIAVATNDSHRRLEQIIALNAASARIRHREDLDTLAKVLLDAGEPDTFRHEIANLLQRHDYDELSDILVEVLSNPGESPRFRGYCIQHLWRCGARAENGELEAIRGVLRQALEDDDLPVKREALLALVREKDAVGVDTALKWFRDDSAHDLHDLAIRCVREMDMRGELPRVRAFLESDNAPVQIAAMVTASEWGDEKSRTAFNAALTSTNPRVRRVGRAALARLDARDNLSSEQQTNKSGKGNLE